MILAVNNINLDFTWQQQDVVNLLKKQPQVSMFTIRKRNTNTNTDSNETKTNATTTTEDGYCSIS